MDPAKVTPDGYAPVDGDLGQVVLITGGAGWSVGTYTVTGVPGDGTWVLDREPAAGFASGGVWRIFGRGVSNGGAIGLSLDAVQGADVEYPVLEFSLASRVELMSFAKLRQLRSVVRRTNDAPWNGFAAGELLYLGAEPTSPEGTLEDGGDRYFWNLAHHFRYEPNQANVRVGDIVLPFVGGHEYVWARYGADVSQLVPLPLRALVQKPTVAYVERVYDSIDFDTLGIEL